MLSGIGPTMNLVDNLKENFWTAFAKKSDVEEIEKTVDIISKYTIHDEHKKKRESDRKFRDIEDKVSAINMALVKLDREFNELTESKIKLIETWM